MKSRKKITEVSEQLEFHEKCSKTGKLSFRSKASINKHIRNYQSKGTNENKLFAYKCSICYKWHMTSQRPSFIPGIHN